MRRLPQSISVLAIRLAVWFILLTSLPVLIIIFFTRQNAQATFTNFESDHHYEMAGMLAGQVALSGHVEDAQRLLSILEDGHQIAFILNQEGTYLAHMDEGKINRRVQEDFAPEIVQTILSQRDGLYAEQTTPYFFAFRPVPNQDAVVVVAGDGSSISTVMRLLERDSYIQLLISVGLIFVGGASVIWLLVGQPVRKLAIATEQVGAGQLDVQVDPSHLTDELAALATSFNTMVIRIKELLENLDQHLAARTQELSAFFELATLVSSGKDLPEILEPALSRILEISHSQAICVHMRSENEVETVLHLIAQRTLTNNSAEKRLQLITPAGEFARWFGQISDPIATNTLLQATIVPPNLKLTQCQSYLGMQIRIKGRPQGLLSCFRASDQGFAMNEISLLVALADELGIMVENHRLRQQSETMAIAAERQLLARDLHDDVAQTLYSLNLFARAGKDALREADSAKLERSLDYMETNALQALKEMRLLLYKLHPADMTGDQDLAAALNRRFNEVERRLGIQASIEVAAALPDCPNKQREIYRIVVEALNNSLKHANASQVQVDVCATNGGVRICVRDNGSGFDSTRQQTGMGLQSIQERAGRLPGRLTINSQPDQGTEVCLWLAGDDADHVSDTEPVPQQWGKT